MRWPILGSLALQLPVSQKSTRIYIACSLISCKIGVPIVTLCKLTLRKPCATGPKNPSRVVHLGSEREAGVSSNEGGDAEKAFSAAQDGQAAKVPARLRTFLPALLAFAERGDADGACQVERFPAHSCCKALPIGSETRSVCQTDDRGFHAGRQDNARSWA